MSTIQDPFAVQEKRSQCGCLCRRGEDADTSTYRSSESSVHLCAPPALMHALLWALCNVRQHQWRMLLTRPAQPSTAPAAESASQPETKKPALAPPALIFYRLTAQETCHTSQGRDVTSCLLFPRAEATYLLPTTYYLLPTTYYLPTCACHRLGIYLGTARLGRAPTGDGERQGLKMLCSRALPREPFLVQHPTRSPPTRIVASASQVRRASASASGLYLHLRLRRPRRLEPTAPLSLTNPPSQLPCTHTHPPTHSLPHSLNTTPPRLQVAPYHGCMSVSAYLTSASTDEYDVGCLRNVMHITPNPRYPTTRLHASAAASLDLLHTSSAS